MFYLSQFYKYVLQMCLQNYIRQRIYQKQNQKYKYKYIYKRIIRQKQIKIYTRLFSIHMVQQVFINQQKQRKTKMLKSTTIKVGVKIKPILQSTKQCLVKTSQAQGKQPVVFVNIGNQNKRFQVDVVHDGNQSKETMFKDLQIDRMVEKFISGFNVTIMAYGQTGAGKTYCMEGNQEEPGIITDSIRMIFDRTKQDATISCSYIQLYNEKIFDLLVDDANVDNLKLRWQVQRDFIVEDLSSHIAKSSKDMQKIWKKGTKNRVVASNKIHDFSSRSHALFMVTISDKDQQGNYRIRQLTFVDLAGSQRLFDHLGKLSKQSIQINKSLFVLRKVIKILQQATLNKKQQYIPYRDSKLTSLLKKALGGNCITMMIACIDSVEEQRQETLLTLSYAISTGRIQNSAHVNIDQQALENKQLRTENQKLKKQLQAAWKQIDIMHKRQKAEGDKKSMTEYSHKIIQCIGTIRQLIKSNKELREQLEQQRKVKRQQKIQIQMLMEQRYMLKKYNSLNQSPSPKKMQASMHITQFQKNFSQSKGSPEVKSSHNGNGMYSVKQKEEVSPHKIIRIRQIMGPVTTSPIKNSGGQTEGSRKPNSTVNKRTRYVFHKTQPDEILEYRPPKSDKFS